MSKNLEIEYVDILCNGSITDKMSDEIAKIEGKINDILKEHGHKNVSIRWNN